MKQLSQILRPEYTYDLFYFRFFAGRGERDFLPKLNNNFKGHKKFLSKLGFKELLNDDELIFDISREGKRTNCKSYFDNGRLKFEYTLDKDEDYKIAKSTETFELFYKDCQPKFRFSYQIDEEDLATGDYQTFYNNGQLKEKGYLSYSDNSFETFSKKGQIIEYFSGNAFYKYHDNEKLHYGITLDGSRKHGPYELYDRAGDLLEKGTYTYDEMFDGSFESYFEDGHIHKKCYYKNGVLDGPFYEGNGYGGAIKNWYFIDGQRV